MIKPAPLAPRPDAAEVRLAVTRSVAAGYRRAQVFGLLLIAGFILGVVLLRADPRVLFSPGWWR